MEYSIQGRWNERDAIYHTESDKSTHAGPWEEHSSSLSTLPTFGVQHTPLESTTVVPGCKQLSVLHLSKAFQGFSSLPKQVPSFWALMHEKKTQCLLKLRTCWRVP